MPSALTAVLACVTTFAAAFIAVRPFYGVALTTWDSFISPRVGRWFDLAGAVGLAFTMAGWFIPLTRPWLGAWLIAVVAGAGLGVVAMRSRQARVPAES
ncbi:hypothetical protein [Cellulomonas sp. SLBN-39]|uniref:hypothetical protein n=1 Tax=Cellulomonas sp. SLBN-39 TaxID=2768446 RepID=UPI00114EA6EF|nr:hypothetical protein [Cellulomonas sp. SLBN-39]TQL01527.1 hypothetical protein FBY24_0579 [Cellulomonas sp. SLBN-39]